jgi:hypothetical protein
MCSRELRKQFIIPRQGTEIFSRDGGDESKEVAHRHMLYTSTTAVAESLEARGGLDQRIAIS